MAPKKFCYRTPIFPKHGFIGNIHFKDNNLHLGFFSVSTLYTSTSEFCLDMIRLTKHWRQEVLSHIEDTAVLIPLVFKEAIPLKKEYWENPNIEMPMSERQRHFNLAITHYSFYEVLCTPYKFKKPYTLLSAAFAFPVTTSKKTLNQFMYSSKYPVLTAANSAALYTCLRPYEINWKTNNRMRETP